MEHKPILFPWQQRWVADRSRLKIAVKATQIGFSFGESYADVVDSLERDNNLWAILSRSERQALEFARKCKDHCNAIGAIAQLTENQSFQGTSMLQHVIEFPNKSRIIVLTSNPDTARGYTGNVTLDEFAFHKDSKAVFAAAYGRATRGFMLRVISTAFGEQGKFYELAKLCDLVSGRPPLKQHAIWSGHWCDIYRAANEGFCNADGSRFDVEGVLAGVEDPDIRDQEYLCIFLSDAADWIPFELILAAQSVDSKVIDIEREVTAKDAQQIIREALSSISMPPGAEPYMGSDIGRHRDLTCYWPIFHFPAIDMVTTPIVVRLRNRKFKEQREIAEILMDSLEIRRLCQDATGIGAQLGEELADKYGLNRVEPITFTLAVKEDLAVRQRRRFEDRSIRIPDDKNVEGAIHAVKKIPTAAGHFRFDAERTDKGHADEFWACALALMAISGTPDPAMGSANPPETIGRERGLMSRISTDSAEREGVTERTPLMEHGRRNLWGS